MTVDNYSVRECPFCGSYDTGGIYDKNDSGWEWYQVCYNCGATGPKTADSVESNRAWNKRGLLIHYCKTCDNWQEENERGFPYCKHLGRECMWEDDFCSRWRPKN